jgi:chemotaxis protein methyltransferase CheR
LRNVALLEVLRDLAARKPVGADLRVASVGCSTGAELYSLLWFVRSARPDLRIAACGLDVSQTAITKADAGVFSESDEELSWLSETQVAALFDKEGGVLKVKSSLRQGVSWLVADAMDPALSQILEPQDFLLANNFLGPLQDKEAEKCLCNLSRLVKPGGYLVVFGLDLDFRTCWMKSRSYMPVSERIEEVHLGDRAMLDWPWTRCGVEPLEKTRADWVTRYAAVFQVPAG